MIKLSNIRKILESLKISDFVFNINNGAGNVKIIMDNKVVITITFNKGTLQKIKLNSFRGDNNQLSKEDILYARLVYLHGTGFILSDTELAQIENIVKKQIEYEFNRNLIRQSSLRDFRPPKKGSLKALFHKRIKELTEPNGQE